jgi:uncharacterized protein YjbJ (UPF0337 family)
MNENRIAGTARNIGGTVEDVGRITGDTQEQVQGKLDQAAGSAQDLYGQTAKWRGTPPSPLKNGCAAPLRPSPMRRWRSRSASAG